jgi:hypothetical protein
LIALGYVLCSLDGEQDPTNQPTPTVENSAEQGATAQKKKRTTECSDSFRTAQLEAETRAWQNGETPNVPNAGWSPSLTLSQAAGLGAAARGQIARFLTRGMSAGAVASALGVGYCVDGVCEVLSDRERVEPYGPLMQNTLGKVSRHCCVNSDVAVNLEDLLVGAHQAARAGVGDAAGIHCSYAGMGFGYVSCPASVFRLALHLTCQKKN